MVRSKSGRFRQPQIILTNPKTGTTLCEYTLEVQSLRVANLSKDISLPLGLLSLWHHHYVILKPSGQT